MQYTYDIIDLKIGQIEEDNGCSLFDTENEARKDAENAIKRLIKEPLDHRILNEVLPFNPTAENLARWCVERVPYCYKATVQESKGNIATYELD